jgi:catechol 2,3-dioxygenase-like lactoylglutathione lyase family enzyme
VSPWYTEKLGLRKLAEGPPGESSSVAFKFKEDGNSVILTTHRDFGTYKSPIFFTKKLGKIREVLATRGVAAGPVKQDRQGTRYFEIQDPEGNAIEVVQET